MRLALVLVLQRVVLGPDLKVLVYVKMTGAAIRLASLRRSCECHRCAAL